MIKNLFPLQEDDGKDFILDDKYKRFSRCWGSDLNEENMLKFLSMNFLIFS